MKIVSISAELQVFEGQADYDHPLRLAIAFDDGSLIRLLGRGDGEGVIVDRLPLEEPVDLEECGHTGIFDMTDRLDKNLRNIEISQPISINSSASKLIGLALPHVASDPFCVWMDDDEFYWGTASVLRNWTTALGREAKFGGPVEI